ncbi:MAG: TonB-dependent receptor [Proteobacteria bacterium]|nr:TonB-dependent receptor [Pseudomonadota bacterium]
MSQRIISVAVAALFATQATSAWIALEGRLLTDVLADYEAAGYAFLYSSDLVKRDTLLTVDPPGEQPAERLRKALQAIGLDLTTTPGSTALRIVLGELTAPSKQVVRNEATPRIEELLVTSRYILKKSVAGTQHTLGADELNAIPELGDDALRAANHLPGVSTIGVSAKPHIRGGLQDEMLVLFNNVELLEPFHLKDFQSVFSGFNPSLIKSIDVYTGGFPARYGDRMSGVVEIFPADRPEGLGGELTLSLLTSAVAMYSTIADQGDWAVSARRGNLDLVTKQVNPTLGTPSYSDFYAQIRADVGARTDIEAGAIYYDDDIVLKDLTDLTGEIAESRYRNTYGWLQMHREWSDHVNSSTVLSYGKIQHDRQGYLNDPEPEEGSGVLSDDRQFELLSLTHHTTIDTSADVAFEAGGRLSPIHRCPATRCCSAYTRLQSCRVRWRCGTSASTLHNPGRSAPRDSHWRELPPADRAVSAPCSHHRARIDRSAGRCVLHRIQRRLLPANPGQEGPARGWICDSCSSSYNLPIDADKLKAVHFTLAPPAEIHGDPAGSPRPLHC